MRVILKISLCLFLLLVPACGQAKDAASKDHVLDIQKVTSPGGITAWLVEDHTLPIIAIEYAFKDAGSAHDPADKQGLSILASNTMDEGAGEYDSATFQKLLTDNNIGLSFRANRDYFGGRLKILTKDKDLAFKLLALALTKPRFDADPLERMRAANLARVRSSLSDPDWKAARLENDIVYNGHPYALNSGGTLTTLQNITADDLHNFVKARLGRGRLKIGVMGDISADELGKVLDQVFGGLPAKTDLPAIPDLTLQNPGETVLYKEDIPQTIIEIAQPGIGRKDPEYYTAMVMNYILGGGGFGSRMTEEIREKRGLTYGVGSYFSDLDHAKSYNISTSTKNESAAEVLSLIKQEMQKMKDTPVTDKELANAKSYLIGSFPLSLSSTDRIARMMLGLQLDDLPIDYLDQRTGRINAVTAAGIQNLAQKLIVPDKLTTIMVGKPEGVTPTKTVDTLPNVE